jgi:hypothetical protein
MQIGRAPLFAAERDNASLITARRNGWTIASIKQDWKKMFSFEPRAAN